MKKAVLVILFSVLFSIFYAQSQELQPEEVTCDEHVTVRIGLLFTGFFHVPYVYEYRFLRCSDGTEYPL